ncbi:MAG: GxxExxY protein [Ignavibacteria bacterium]|jgi:GxxExxY protein|nr:GxxExxY protein [Ignavibacteria bacterium]
MAELLYKDLTERIIKVFLEVYNHLGFGFSKEIYLEALKIEMEIQKLEFKSSIPVDVLYKEKPVGKYHLDFVNEDKVILLVDVKERINEDTEYTIVNHLKSTKYEIGLVLNFGRRPEVKRKIYQNQRKTFTQKGENA